jgi:uncharacterized protein (TIGR03089 family)
MNTSGEPSPTNARAHPTVVHAFAATLASSGALPLITFYDDATGERVELSAATLGNWVAKTANMLVDGLALGPGEVAAVRLAPHWQTAAILLGCWTAGLTVDLAGTGDAAVAFGTEPIPAVGDVYALSLAALGLPLRPGPPPGTADFVEQVRAYGDQLPPLATTPGQVALAPDTRHDTLTAMPNPVLPGSRVLIDAVAHPDPRTWLVAPLLAGASVVLCRNLDPARVDARLETERATLLPVAS